METLVREVPLIRQAGSAAKAFMDPLQLGRGLNRYYPYWILRSRFRRCEFMLANVLVINDLRRRGSSLY